MNTLIVMEGLEDLIGHICDLIEMDEYLQYDDIEELMCEMCEECSRHATVIKPLEALYQGLYDSKCALSEVRSELQKLRSSCQQLRLSVA